MTLIKTELGADIDDKIETAEVSRSRIEYCNHINEMETVKP